MSLHIQVLEDGDIGSVLDAVAELRISVFREFPYLYDGSLDYERRYLSKFAAADGAIVVTARDGDKVVGAATACPLAAEHDAFQIPLRSAGYNVSRVYYCAESVLLPSYRGRGLGHAFFDAREAKARALGFEKIAFCGVVRPDDDARRPAAYRPLDRFWRKRGYEPIPDVMARFSWRDVGEHQETEKRLQFWIKTL